MLPLLLAALAAPTLQVRCAPEAPERGAIVTCSARLNPPGPATLVERRASAGGHVLSETEGLLLERGAVDWSGPAVVDTAVIFRLRPKGASRDLAGAARFTVRPRQWPATLGLRALPWEYGPDELFGGHPPRIAPGSSLEDPVPGRGALAVTRVTLENPPWALAAEGPNARWYYTVAPLTAPATFRVFLSRALREGDPFFELQHVEPLRQTPGLGRKLSMTVGNEDQHCDREAMEKLRADILRHEGAVATSEPNHRSAYEAALGKSFALQADLEALTGHLDEHAPPQPSFTDVLSTRVAAHLDRLREEQAWLEQSASRVLFRCTLRYPAAADAGP